MPEIIEELDLDTLTFQHKKEQEPIAPKSRHYVDDAHLTSILGEWKNRYTENKNAGIDPPPLPEAVGEAILDMTEQMGRRHNFSGYSYLDEMKSEAMIHCVKYIHNFNPHANTDNFKKKKISAFAYINMIIWRSFTHYIGVEKHQQYLKYKSFEHMGGMDAFQDEEMATASGEEGESSGLSVGVLGADFIQKAREYEEQYLEKRVKKDKKKVAFDNFMFDAQETEGVDLTLGEELVFE
jgi:hypothetical protein